jgi:hypothetical protein
MDTASVLNFISGLELKEPQEQFKTKKKRSLTNNFELVAEGKEQIFIADKSIVSFVSQVGNQNRKDVLNSTLFAQMAAHKKFPDEKNLIEWYNTFVNVLSSVGWNIEASEFAKWESSKSILEVENVIIDILTAAFGANYIAIIKNTLESIKKLSDGNNKLNVFEKNTHTLSKGCFQMAIAVEENDTVALQLATFFLTSKNEIQKIIFFKSTKDSTKLEYASKRGTLNTELYSQIRFGVLEKLGTAIKNNIAEIEI